VVLQYSFAEMKRGERKGAEDRKEEICGRKEKIQNEKVSSFRFAFVISQFAFCIYPLRLSVPLRTLRLI